MRLTTLIIAVLTVGAYAPMAAANDLQPTGQSIEEFISPDGSLDLEAVRQSDYQGPLA